MRRDRHQLRAIGLATGATIALLGGWLALVVVLLRSAMGAAAWAELVHSLEPHFALLVLLAIVLVVTVGMLARAAYRHWVLGPARLAERAQALLGPGPHTGLPLEGDEPQRVLARTINALAGEREALRRDIEARVAGASQGIEQERSRLAALMSELAQSVIVCNLDGRVLLYNNRARMQLRALSSAPSVADGADLLGLGRSIYTVLDRRLVAHALQGLVRRLERGADAPVATFVTVTRAGQLLRVQLAPVRFVPDTQGGEPQVPHGGSPSGADDANARPRQGAAKPSTQAGAGPATLSGFVLVIDNVTREFESKRESERLLRAAIQGIETSLATHDQHAGVPALRASLSMLVALAAEQAATQWPVEEMLMLDLLQAARQRIEAATGASCQLEAPSGECWLRVDSYALVQLFEHLALRLTETGQAAQLALRVSVNDTQASLDLCWSDDGRLEPSAMARWEDSPIHGGGPHAPTVRDLVARHRGEFWFQRERAGKTAFFRLLLPLASPADTQAGSLFQGPASRPEFYDFDLFDRADTDHALDERELSSLAFTVFDTETTGLDPSAGDEIIQIGAVRIVNGRLLRSESFEQLVDPGRSIPAASIPIHGIEPQMVAGKPRIDQVLPAFHDFAADTVLVAHNAAFDMRFLELKQQQTGVVFAQPVLDTLLLSAIVHPNQQSHRLESIAERFGIPVIGRHTALGDALVTAEVLLRLMPLLAERGIRTLAQAREAARKTYYARLKY